MANYGIRYRQPTNDWSYKHMVQDSGGGVPVFWEDLGRAEIHLGEVRMTGVVVYNKLL